MKKRPVNKKPGDWIGSMKGTAEILGDIMSPVSQEADWEAAQDEKPEESSGNVVRKF